MKLCLVRHGEAKSEAEDPQRPLSPRGVATARRMGRFLKAAAALSVGEIRHSTKLRAKQTAQLLAEELGWRGPVREVAGLGPLDDVSAMAEALAAETADLILVGHLPHLNRLASRLVAGDERLEAFEFPPGGALCLRRSAGGGEGGGAPAPWTVEWVVAPELLPSG